MLARDHLSLHQHSPAGAADKLMRMAGGQCPLKGGQLTTTAAMGNWSIN
jgi:hypothetical protein